MFWRSQQQKQFCVILFSHAASLLHAAENLSSETCDSQYNGGCGDSQVLLQVEKPKDQRFKVLEKVGFCRSPEYIQKWFGKIVDVGDLGAADCWAACTEGTEKGVEHYHTFSNDGVYSYCYCNYECKCMAAPGLSSTIVRADFKGQMPAACTDCPQLAGTYSYKGPSTDPEGTIELQQHKCLGIVAGKGRFVVALSNSGIGRIGMRTMLGSMEAHGFIFGERGSHEIKFDNGYIYTQISEKCKCDDESGAECVCGHTDGYSAPNGWDFLEKLECSGGARVFASNRMQSMLGGHGKSSLGECADYATRNHAFYFSFSSCPPPEEKYTLEAQSCGKPGCINKNKGHVTFSEAWQACGRVETCAVIMRWKNGKYYLRRSTDPVYKGRRPLKQPISSVPYFCPEERNRCDIWNTCQATKQNQMFLAYHKACPSSKQICDGDAECTVGCECPLCDDAWGAMPLPPGAM